MTLLHGLIKIKKELANGGVTTAELKIQLIALCIRLRWRRQFFFFIDCWSKNPNEQKNIPHEFRIQKKHWLFFTGIALWLHIDSFIDGFLNLSQSKNPNYSSYSKNKKKKISQHQNDFNTKITKKKNKMFFSLIHWIELLAFLSLDVISSNWQKVQLDSFYVIGAWAVSVHTSHK